VRLVQPELHDPVAEHVDALVVLVGAGSVVTTDDDTFCDGVGRASTQATL
jgi:hypothetical protein